MEAATPTSTPGAARIARSIDRAHDDARRDAQTGVRERRVLEQLERLLPALLADGRLLTIWFAGCGDGSELCRLGAHLDRLGALERTLLLGTDADERKVAAARRTDDAGLTPPHVRARIRWEQRDLLRDGAPRAGWLLVICRERTCDKSEPANRSSVHATLAASLARGGLLVLGCRDTDDRLEAPGLERLAENVYRRLLTCPSC
jgi:chemotaxis methyl-accepting protein methylase